MTGDGRDPSHVGPWGDTIEVVVRHGVPFRTYAQRPRRVEHLLEYGERWDSRLFVVQGEFDVTFADLRRSVAVKAEQLRALGVQPQQYVMILGWNSPDWIVNFWASLLVGAVPVLANAWWSDIEVGDAVSRVRPTLILADKGGAAKLPARTSVGPWEADFTSSSTFSPVEFSDEEEPAVVIFTSGTSGTPKAVVLSHRSLLAGLQMLLHISRRLPQQVDESSGDVGLHTGPLFHIGGVQTLLRSVIVGGTLVMPSGRFDPGEVLRLVELYQISRWSAVPTMVSRVLDHPDVGTRNVSSLKSITVGGAPVHSELLERIRTGLPGADARVPTGYGLTENGGQATAASGRDSVERPGSSGRPLPCVELKFVPRPGLPDGEILLRSPTQMSGYLETTESLIDGEGWLHTGDLGHLDDGHLWITGRSKELIIRGGENIAPVAVERALMTLPGVLEVAVIGVPDPELGEEVAAFVVTDDEGLTTERLVRDLRGLLASFAVPSKWYLQREHLPTNHTHKVDKNELAERAKTLDWAEGGLP